MSDIANLTQAFPVTYPKDILSVRPPHDAGAPGDYGDRVEISAAAARANEVFEPSSFRLARANAIRAEIENGTFETPERLRGTVDRLLALLA